MERGDQEKGGEVEVCVRVGNVWRGNTRGIPEILNTMFNGRRLQYVRG